MRPFAFPIWTALLLFGFSASSIAAEPADHKIRLEQFGSFRSKPITFVRESDRYNRDAPSLIEQLDRLFADKAKRWSQSDVLQGSGALEIRPEVVQLRLSESSTIPLGSKFVLRISLVDLKSGKVVVQREFDGKTGVIEARNGGSGAMLSQVTNDASGFLNEMYTDAAQEVGRQRAQAFAALLAEADGGDASSQLAVADAYANGRNIPKDEPAAVVWWRRAADQGIAEAQFLLGCAYADGRGVIKDESVAVAFLTKAAAQGKPEAQTRLADMYEDGRGIVRDHKQAQVWYRRAADQGDSRAQLVLARADRDSTKFRSYDEAFAALRPAVGADYTLRTDPLSLSGKLFSADLEIAQIIGTNNMLLTTPYLGVPEMDGSVFFAEVSKSYAGQREFIDRQRIQIVGEIRGTFRYTTAMNTQRTVPRIVIFGIRSLGNRGF